MDLGSVFIVLIDLLDVFDDLYENEDLQQILRKLPFVYDEMIVSLE
ncbi:hypothetical protein [Oceanobacillus profundus]|nr:hypothetical protein [Oceanobacillus profundus]